MHFTICILSKKEAKIHSHNPAVKSEKHQQKPLPRPDFVASKYKKKVNEEQLDDPRRRRIYKREYYASVNIDQNELGATRRKKYLHPHNIPLYQTKLSERIHIIDIVIYTKAAQQRNRLFLEA